MYKYEVFEFKYKNNGSDTFESLLNNRSKDGFELFSTQFKPFKDVATNSYELVCVFRKEVK